MGIANKFNPQILLPGHLIIASPNMDDPYFNKAVIMLCSHDEEGAFGLLINRHIGYINAEIMQTSANDDAKPKVFDVLVGGPVEPDASLVLTIQEEDLLNFNIHPLFTLYNNAEDYIADHVVEKSSEYFMVFKGYCSWAPGQLDQEMQENVWIARPPSLEMIQSTAYKKKWNQCMKDLKIKNMKGFVNYSGNS